ncbi:MAG: Asp-tRNA(Asn)/Glu-tRNA(Gln) amidotransferase subunit GatB [Nitrospinota bacterium]|nr:Asp-tRNA(Asn)/Glu-tRNA(Gln) amidotransferase subunit GatB [Nitrospinota bacterium]
MEYIPVIGLEVHVQSKTETKMFCACSTRFGEKPNNNVCPICLGMPGMLPVINKKGVELAIKTSLAINCKIEPLNQFARKNYFYPDLPKGYQISQYDLPIATGGYIDIGLEGAKKRIGITRLHMEEDAGKLIHGDGGDQNSYVDLNRAGVPLMEIVSEPDMRSSEEAKEYMTRLKEILEYIEVSDCNMEEGSLRCDANVSVMPVGSNTFGTRAEIKNLNSFRFMQKAIEYEIERQIEILEDGGRIIQETRLFDSAKGITISMRSKEEAHDYRYFPEPDLQPIVVKNSWVEEIRKELPELPEAKRQRFISEYSLSEYDVGVLSSSIALGDYFEKTVSKYNNPKASSNWIMGEVLRLLKDGNINVADFNVTPERLSELLVMIEEGKISGKMGKAILEDMAKENKTAQEIVEEKGLAQISGKDDIAKIIDEVIASHPQEAEDYRGGKDRLFGFFVGQVLKASKGKANPQTVNELLKEKL